MLLTNKQTNKQVNTPETSQSTRRVQILLAEADYYPHISFSLD